MRRLCEFPHFVDLPIAVAQRREKKHARQINNRSDGRSPASSLVSILDGLHHQRREWESRRRIRALYKFPLARNQSSSGDPKGSPRSFRNRYASFSICLCCAFESWGIDRTPSFPQAHASREHPRVLSEFSTPV